jgi:hypothetical protein
MSVQREHILKNIDNIYQDKLPENTHKLVKALSDITKIKLEKLDYSEDSLYELDYYLLANRQKIDEDFIKKYFFCFFIYAGEVYIRKYAGQWQMILYKDNITWQPFIREKNDTLFNLFSWIYESMAIDDWPTITSGYFPSVNNFFTKED